MDALAPVVLLANTIAAHAESKGEELDSAARKLVEGIKRFTRHVDVGDLSFSDLGLADVASEKGKVSSVDSVSAALSAQLAGSLSGLQSSIQHLRGVLRSEMFGHANHPVRPARPTGKKAGAAKSTPQKKLKRSSKAKKKSRPKKRSTKKKGGHT